MLDCQAIAPWLVGRRANVGCYLLNQREEELLVQGEFSGLRVLVVEDSSDEATKR